MPFEIILGDDDPRAVDVSRHGEEATVLIDGRPHRCSLHHAGDSYEIRVDDRTEPVWVAVRGDTVFVHALGRAWELVVVDPAERARAGAAEVDVVSAPMPGTVVSLAVGPGDTVSAGQPVLVIESMKMHSEITAPRDGVVDGVPFAVGDTFDRAAKLLTLVPEEE